MNQPKVTVLMPVYNGEKYLRQAIDSILNQTFTDFEFLIINDGSTDASESIIRSYHDSRICLVNNTENVKLIATLNKGLGLARGTYIARMDCDDISVPQRLEKQVLFMDGHQEVGVCGGWIQVFAKDNNSYVQKYPADSAEIKALLFFYSSFAHPSVLLRKDVLIKHKLLYNHDFVSAEDYELWLTAGRYTQFANIQEVLLHYRISDQQISFIHRKQQLDTVYKIRETQLNNLGIHPTDKEKIIHVYLIMNEQPDYYPSLGEIRSWISKILRANTQQKNYAEPFFSDLLKRKWFLILLEYRKKRSGIGGCGIQGFFWLMRSLITRKNITKYM